MACPLTLIGRARWSMTRDTNGHRTYKIVNKVAVDTTIGLQQGPASALNTPGLPIPGSLWAIEGDIDLQAVCQWDAVVTPMVDDERNACWLVERIYTTLPNPNCVNRVGTGTGTGNPATDPLAQSPVLSGGFIKYVVEEQVDRYGNPIQNSAFEQIRGPQAEFDRSRPTVRITMNDSSLALDSLAQLIDTVNSTTLWGFDPRCVKLSDITWEQLYSADCECYFRITYEFEIDVNTFDREILDEGTKALNGYWDKNSGTWTLRNIGAFGLGVAPDASNPTHFIRLVDFNGNPMRGILNGAGIPATSGVSSGTRDPGFITVERYPETDFVLALGIPDSLECT